MNGMVLNRVFTQSTFKDMIDNPSKSIIYHSVIDKYVENPEGKSNGEILDELYLYLEKNYRNEYFYKNTLFNKLLLGVHKPTTTTALTEIWVGKSKADFILINGKAIVFEIKTALDSFDRLDMQIRDYYKAFEYVYVLTDEGSKKYIEKRFEGTPVGIKLMTKNNTLSPLKSAEKCIDYLDSEEIFKVLNKSEYEEIIKYFYGTLPDVQPVHYYKECKKLFCQLDMSDSYPMFIAQLKKRNQITLNTYNEVPYVLKSLIYFSKYLQTYYNNLSIFLNQSYKR